MYYIHSTTQDASRRHKHGKPASEPENTSGISLCHPGDVIGMMSPSRAMLSSETWQLSIGVVQNITREESKKICFICILQ